MASHDSEQPSQLHELERDFALVRELGRGGSSVVYLARERALSRDVAVKLIRPSHLVDESAIARLAREAQTVGRLQHPNIVTLLGTRHLGEHGLALILQYVPGQTLKDRIREDGPLPFDEAESVLRDVARALAYAHRQRIVHRDVKPENVYLDEDAGIARLADFGIARVWDSDSGLTLPGEAIGTPAYMSPEQVDGHDLDGRSDIYSLGLLGFEALSGQQPWAGETLYNIIYKQKHERLPSLPRLRPGVPPNLCRALDGALQKEKADRWATAEEFLEALEDRSEFSALFPRRRPEADRPGATPAASGNGGAHPPNEGRPGPRPSPHLGTASPSGSSSPPAPSAEGGRDERRSEREVGKEREAPQSQGPLVAAGLGLFLVSAMATATVLVAGSDGWLDGFAGLGISAGEETLSMESLAVAPVASRLAVVEGDGQEAWSATPLERPVVVRVEGEDGSPVPDAPVTFAVASGGGAVAPTTARTDARGLAQARWTLGPGAGAQSLSVRAEGEAGREGQSALVTTFSARAVPPVPRRLVALDGADQSAEPGATLPAPLRIRAVAADGRPVPNTPLVFEVGAGSGSVIPYTTSTDSAGVAEVRWTLGSAPGTQELSARSVDGAIQVAFRAEAREPGLAARAGVRVGGHHTCRLDGAGEIRCWGRTGVAGRAAAAGQGAPDAGSPGTGSSFARVSAGGLHACALDRQGRAYCWGANDHGQLGDGSTTPRSRPVPVAGELPSFVEIAAGAEHTCALTSEGRVYCWGANDHGQLGNEGTAPRSTPVPVASDLKFRSITMGWYHGCALDDADRAHCWGSNSEAQLARITHGATRQPRPVGGGHRFRQLSAGANHSCGLRANGSALCWGSNDAGQLGRGPGEGGWEPLPVRSEEPFRTVVAGARFSCGIGWDGRAYCWGANGAGQLGDGTRTDRPTPMAVEELEGVVELDAWGSHACADTGDGARFCWGANADGQLGDGTREDRPAPVSTGG
jgi:serine/threonine protein kinase